MTRQTIYVDKLPTGCNACPFGIREATTYCAAFAYSGIDYSPNILVDKAGLWRQDRPGGCPLRLIGKLSEDATPLEMIVDYNDNHSYEEYYGPEAICPACHCRWINGDSNIPNNFCPHCGVRIHEKVIEREKLDGWIIGVSR